MNQEQIIELANKNGIEKNIVQTNVDLLKLFNSIRDYGVKFCLKDDEISTAAVVDRMADVLISIEQLKYLLECDQELKQSIQAKLNLRLKNK